MCCFGWFLGLWNGFWGQFCPVLSLLLALPYQNVLLALTFKDSELEMQSWDQVEDICKNKPSELLNLQILPLWERRERTLRVEREDLEKGWRNENPHPSVHPSIRQSIHSVILLFIRPLLGAHSVSGTVLIAQRTKTAKIRFLLSSKAHHRRKPCWCPVCQQAPWDSAQRPGSRGRWEWELSSVGCPLVLPSAPLPQNFRPYPETAAASLSSKAEPA